MEHLFRLMLHRPAIKQDETNPSIDLTQESDYQGALRHAIGSGNVDEAAASLSLLLIASPRFLGVPADNPYADALVALGAALDDLTPVSPATVKAAILAAFTNAATKVVAEPAFDETLHRLRDSIVAIKAVQEEHSRPIEALIEQLRLMELVARVASDKTYPADAESLAGGRRRSLQLPGDVKITPRTSTSKQNDDLRERNRMAREERAVQVEQLVGQHEALRAALADLGRVKAEHLNTTVQERSDAVLAPEQLRSEAIGLAHASFIEDLRGLQVKYAETSLERQRVDVPGTLAAATSRFDKSLFTPTAAMSGRPGFVPQSVSFTLREEGQKSLAEGTKAVLAERGLDLSTTPLDRVTDHLGGEVMTLTGKIEQLAGHPEMVAFKRVGGALIQIKTPLTSGWAAFGTGGYLPLPVVPFDGRIPHTKGKVLPSGLADLIVVRQQLTGYEGADVAHIENVLKGESKGREHFRRQETVTTTFSESEVSSAEEHELESTNRYEMSRETSQTIKEDVQLKAGLKVSGKYGPVVEFAVSAEGSYQRTKEEATKSAAKFSQDVTERSSKKISQRLLNRTTVVITNEVTEKNTHGIDNTTGAGHISGVYQWVNKVYRAQMFNYGLRAMFDFMVPEPGSFLIATMNRSHASTLSVTKPAEFTLQPGGVNESNYGYWVRLYRSTDVVPPPEQYKTVSLDFKAGGGDDKTNYNHSAQLSIDEGYRAVWGTVGAVSNVWDNTATVDVVLGQRTHRMGDTDWMWATSLNDEQGSIPVAIDTFRKSQVAVAVEVKCQRTDRAMEKWRLETHAKLMTAYQARLAEYEEKLAQLELQAGVAIHGRNPVANQATISEELKKNCVSILTDQQFDLFDAINPAPATGLPEIDLFEAAGEGPYVRFFEQAFEWEHMTWVTYPYFWGRKSEWDERMGYDDPDPAFADFLRAGYARVTVPARPGFETAIDHFLTFGEIWNGGPLPAVSNPLYLPIADELAARLGRPENEVPQGDPWTVKVPTELVHLRADDKLPTWVQNPSGEWVEAP
jgi:hypothetical protein